MVYYSLYPSLRFITTQVLRLNPPSSQHFIDFSANAHDVTRTLWAYSPVLSPQAADYPPSTFIVKTIQAQMIKGIPLSLLDFTNEPFVEPPLYIGWDSMCMGLDSPPPT